MKLSPPTSFSPILFTKEGASRGEHQPPVDHPFAALHETSVDGNQTENEEAV